MTLPICKSLKNCPECGSQPKAEQTCNGYYLSLGCENGHKWIGVDVPYDAFKYLEMYFRIPTVEYEAKTLWNERLCGEKAA